MNRVPESLSIKHQHISESANTKGEALNLIFTYININESNKNISALMEAILTKINTEWDILQHVNKPVSAVCGTNCVMSRCL